MTRFLMGQFDEKNVSHPWRNLVDSKNYVLCVCLVYVGNHTRTQY